MRNEYDDVRGTNVVDTGAVQQYEARSHSWQILDIYLQQKGTEAVGFESR